MWPKAVRNIFSCSGEILLATFETFSLKTNLYYHTLAHLDPWKLFVLNSEMKCVSCKTRFQKRTFYLRGQKSKAEEVKSSSGSKLDGKFFSLESLSNFHIKLCCGLLLPNITPKWLVETHAVHYWCLAFNWLQTTMQIFMKVQLRLWNQLWSLLCSFDLQLLEKFWQFESR